MESGPFEHSLIYWIYYHAALIRRRVAACVVKTALRLSLTWGQGINEGYDDKKVEGNHIFLINIID